ncbi:hypothetical protein N657DRAFT_656613 [Parathielavia appendiculata]|uniref:Hsp90 chaperone protein kinase-targeting subunit n=1 Tax=Parathielavia appendiculata TaxID=2587402 RepID=A0AAN6TZV8_9PEZI|nr:hypothetical protein N657DRAFT_656613 [Parathielavia appendiculata]
MPVDYSKWDALELSDDSDIEVHPNVDKRSFIRAKQNQIHMERQKRKHEIETLKYERIINDTLIKRISSLIDSLKAHASDARSGNPGEVAFRAVMESAAGPDPKDDQPPPRPEGVHNAEEPLPTYTKMMATLLDQVNKTLDEKKIEQDKRYDGMVAEIEDHLKKVNSLQDDLIKRLTELEKEESRKITSESIHTGFDSSHINKSTSSSSGGAKDSSKVELLNPNFAETTSLPASSSSRTDDKNDDDEITASPLAKEFAQIKSTSYRDSLAFLSQHPQILTEKETDGLLVLAFDAQLENRSDFARNCVHQALLLQYCRALGRDGVALFFKRITTPGHQAQEVFHKDVQDTYARIKTRAREIVLQRAKDEAEGKTQGEVEQIQLHAVEPGTVINIRIPEKDSQDEEVRRGREIFEGFSEEMKSALETGKLEEVNKVLGEMPVAEAEEVVGKLGEAGILSLEEEIIDATTDEGKEKIKQLEEQGRAGQYADDPE